MLQVSDGKTPVLLDTHLGVKIIATCNKYKNGFAIHVSGESGRYSVIGCQQHRFFDLAAAIAEAKKYIDKWQIK